MIIKKYHSIMQTDEASRNRWASGLSIFFSVLVLISFVFYKGFLSFGGDQNLASEKNTQAASAIQAKDAPSPLESSKDTIGGLFETIISEYSDFKDSIGAVLVPFVTGIDVYERK